jgi:HNH endonuclease
VGVPDDTTIATGVRRWIDYLACGSRDDRAELALLSEEAGRGFPAALAAVALAQLDERTLYKTFEDEDLQELYDVSCAAGLSSAGERFRSAVLARPYIDDGKIPQAVREAVMDRDGRRCQVCGRTDDLTIDHKIVPWSEGGSSTDPENLQVLCREHNSRKGTRPWTPTEATA